MARSLNSTRNPFLNPLYFKVETDKLGAQRFLRTLRDQIPSDFRPEIGASINGEKVTLYACDQEHSIYVTLLSIAHGGVEVAEKDIKVVGLWASGRVLDTLLQKEQVVEALTELAQGDLRLRAAA